MSVMAEVAAFCSQYAWSVSISSRLFSARLTQRGSVVNFNPNIILLNTFCLAHQRIDIEHVVVFVAGLPGNSDFI